MPREQRTQLAKGPITEVKLGQIKSGVSPTVDMPLVTEQASVGEQLLRGLGVAGEKISELYAIELKEEREKEAKLLKLDHQTEGNYQGDIAGRAAHTEILGMKNEDGSELSAEQQHEEIMKRLRGLKGTLKGQDYSTDFFQAYTKAFVRPLDDLEKSSRKQAEQNVASAKLMKATANVQGKFEDGEASAAEVIQYMRDSGAWENKDLLPAYTKLAISYAKAAQDKAIADPTINTFNSQNFTDTFLKIRAGGGPGGEVDLTINPTTGDKIREYENYLVSDKNKLNTQAKRAYKQVIASMDLDESTTPIEYNKALKQGAELGYYGDSKDNPEVANLQAKFDAKYVDRTLKAVTRALSDEEVEIEKSLSLEENLVSPEVEKELVRYSKVLEKQVAMGIKEPSEAKTELLALTESVRKQQKHLTYMEGFRIDNPQNNTDITTLPPETKKEVKQQVHQQLRAYDEAGNTAQLVKIANANVVSSKAFMSSKMEFTLDTATANEGLAFYKKLEGTADGSDVIVRLPSKQKNFYRALDVISGFLDLDTQSLTEPQVNRVHKLIEETSSNRNFGAELAEKYKTNKEINLALQGLGKRARTDILTIYDYLVELHDPLDAAAYITDNVRPTYIKEYDKGEGAIIAGIGEDKIMFVNGANFPQMAPEIPKLVYSVFKAKGKAIEGDVRITYDEQDDAFVLGNPLNEMGFGEYRLTYDEIKEALGVK